MDSVEKVVGEYFKDEEMTEEVNASLLKEKQSVFGIPVSLFVSVKPIIYPRVKIVESTNYWFLDLRYKPTKRERLLTGLYLLLFFLVFGKVILNISVVTLAIVGGLFTIATLIYGYFFINKGWGIKVYKKEWVKKKENKQDLQLEVNIPKYSRDEIIDYVLKSKIMDFIGITVNSAALVVNYKFRLEK